MIEKISRNICLIKYRKLPLCEYDKSIGDDVNFHPDIYSIYWLKLEDENELPNQLLLLTKMLGVDELVFLRENNKPWISKFTESRQDYKPLIKAVEYFKKHAIEKRFNGGVKVGISKLGEFIENFYMITRCDGGFHDFNFIDENENYLFYIHYSGELKVITLNKNANTLFLKQIDKTNFIDCEREHSNRIK